MQGGGISDQPLEDQIPPFDGTPHRPGHTIDPRQISLVDHLLCDAFRWKDTKTAIKPMGSVSSDKAQKRLPSINLSEPAGSDKLPRPASQFVADGVYSAGSTIR